MQAEFNRNLVKNLPDAYKKTADSNNFKILEVESRTLGEIRDSLREVNNVLDVNNAKGKTLDLYGERVGQARGLADDNKYLLMIKAKIMRNLANGSYPSILAALCATLDCEPSQIYIEDGEQPCTVNIVALPLEVINKSGLTTSQTVAIIKSLLPVGISLNSFLFDGTFEFGESESDYDEEKGFAISEADQSIGGYLGATAGDETDILLPI